MTSQQLPRMLCIMGSGETAPTMTSVHTDLMSRFGSPPIPAVMLDTPFGFQENADDISARAMTYFRDNVGFPIEVPTFRDRETATPLEYETMLAKIAGAHYVFAGPGSPTYALRQWRGTRVRDALVVKLRQGGCVTFASAAAVGLGQLALSVYEVYKVGEPPRWLEGLDVLSELGLHVALIPHYNNAEGGTHDTRYCYMGERRLRMLEEEMPDGVDILGVDEHTAAIFDVDAGTVSIRGRGAITWRHRGASRRWEAGTTIAIAELSAPLSEEVLAADNCRRAKAGRAGHEASEGTTAVHAARRPLPPTSSPVAASTTSPFMEAVNVQSDRARSALAARDVDGAVAALLEIDSTVQQWSADTLDSGEPDDARAVMRRLLVQLGDVARDGARDPRERVAPMVERLLTLRSDLRKSGDYDVADRVRDALIDAGVEIRDTPDGTVWELDSSAQPGARQAL
ncbi:MAG: hypothetical protein ABR498_06820 [Candidatus Dormibacteria bacterium]